MTEPMTDAEVQEWIRNAERQMREDNVRFRRIQARCEANERVVNAAVGLGIGTLMGQMQAFMWGIGEVERRRS